MAETRENPEAGRLEAALLALALGFYALAVPLCALGPRPGWAAYDEESLLDQLQGWREGHGLVLGFGWGSLYRALAAGVLALAGPRFGALHALGLAAVEAEALLLYAWLRRPLGSRAALWAALADLACGATFARAGCLLSVALLPCLFLAAAVGADAVRRRSHALLWGLACGLLLLDYEGWVGALCFLLPYAAWTWAPERRRLWPAAAFGLLLGLALVWRLSPDWAGHVLTRRETSSPDGGWPVQCWLNLKGLLGGGDRLAISGPAGWPWPPPWTWPLAALGALGAWRGKRSLAWLLLCGGLPLGLVNTCLEPHRLCLALLALAACAGAGASLLWRRSWGAALCLALLALGAATEARAWLRIPAAKLELTYGTSRNLEDAARWMARDEPPGGWRLVSGLGWHGDGAFRLLLDGLGARRDGADPVALVYWDDLPGLRLLRPGYRVLSFGAFRPVSLVLLPPADAARLEKAEALLAPLHWNQVSEAYGGQARDALAWLKAPGHGDPWARTAAWELWLQASLQTRQVDFASVLTLLGEPLTCGWAPDVLAVELERGHPGLAARLKAKAEALDPRRAGLSQAERTDRY